MSGAGGWRKVATRLRDAKHDLFPCLGGGEPTPQVETIGAGRGSHGSHGGTYYAQLDQNLPGPTNAGPDIFSSAVLMQRTICDNMCRTNFITRTRQLYRMTFILRLMQNCVEGDKER